MSDEQEQPREDKAADTERGGRCQLASRGTSQSDEKEAAAASAGPRRGPAGEEVRERFSARTARHESPRAVEAGSAHRGRRLRHSRSCSSRCWTKAFTSATGPPASSSAAHRLAQTFSNSEVAPFDEVSLQLLRRARSRRRSRQVDADRRRPGAAARRLQAAADSGVPQSRAEHAPRLRRRLGRDRQLRRHARLRLSARDRRRSLGPLPGSRPASTATTSRSTWRRCCIRRRCSVTRCTASRSTAGTARRLRLQMPTKLGYKQAKYLDTIRVTNVLKGGMRGYWEDQGYSWYGGL